jgi:hypothetical protein
MCSPPLTGKGTGPARGTPTLVTTLSLPVSESGPYSSSQWTLLTDEPVRNSIFKSEMLEDLSDSLHCFSASLQSMKGKSVTIYQFILIYCYWFDHHLYFSFSGTIEEAVNIQNIQHL